MSGDTGSSTDPPATPEPSTTAPPAESTPPATTASPGCGALVPQGASVRIIGKPEAPPAIDDAVYVPDGTYELVQSSYFRGQQSAVPMKKVRAALTVKGSTFTLGAEDTTLTGQQVESSSFLLGTSSLTKTCESQAGAVSAWVFPASLGTSFEAHVQHDPVSGILRMWVRRSDGIMELVFAP